MSGAGRGRRKGRGAAKLRRKKAQARKDAIKDINVRISRNQKLLKEEKDAEHREKLAKRISNLESQKKMCVAKRRFPSEEAARIFSLNSRFDDATRPYRCPHCGGWHLTSKEPRAGEGKPAGKSEG